jgi:hypothetical protein
LKQAQQEASARRSKKNKLERDSRRGHDPRTASLYKSSKTPRDRCETAPPRLTATVTHSLRAPPHPRSQALDVFAHGMARPARAASPSLMTGNEQRRPTRPGSSFSCTVRKVHRRYETKTSEALHKSHLIWPYARFFMTWE